ncbi:MAG: DUF968 domain-containing protein [Alphaproteobacteria bacterium]|nr:DUF968 domain-containing protein [Alphaproteobacteria bacterium]
MTEGPSPAVVPMTEAPADKSALTITMPRRIRDAAHLKYVAALPCLVCGRTPSHAHHLRFAQPRSLGSKVSDEWTVPLCPIHHRTLHDTGREEAWWQVKGIDAKAEAERLWGKTHAAGVSAMLPASGVASRDRSERSTPRLEPASATGTGHQPADVLRDTPAPQSPPTDDRGLPLPLNLKVETS